MTPPNCIGAARRLATLALVGDDADRHSAKPAVAAHKRLAIVRFVFIELDGIENSTKQIAHVVLADFAVKADQSVSLRHG